MVLNGEHFCMKNGTRLPVIDSWFLWEIKKTYLHSIKTWVNAHDKVLHDDHYQCNTYAHRYRVLKAAIAPKWPLVHNEAPLTAGDIWRHWPDLSRPTCHHAAEISLRWSNTSGTADKLCILLVILQLHWLPSFGRCHFWCCNYTE